jgi:predicted nucleotidyltransferase
MSSENQENRKKQEASVEQNISSNYIPKSKIGDLPISNPLEEEIRKKMEKIREDIDKFKKEALKQFRFIDAIGIIPQQVSKKIEEEYEIAEQDCKKNLIHVLTIIPEEKFKEIQKIRVELIKLGKGIDEKIWIHLMTPVDLWNLSLDSKFDIAEILAMSYPVYDKGILGALRVAQIHKSLVLKKFEKYVTSYVFFGSLVRGESKPTSDVDIGIIIDDTDVKRMPRLELKEKLRSIIFQYIQQAIALAGVKNILNVQVWLMTEFWEAVKDAHPVMFTFIRDGVPLYDRGAFLPWKQLLRMGKIRPSPEALDMFMSAGDRLSENVDRRLLDIVMIDIFLGVSTPTQGLLMLYGLAPSNVPETVRLFREVFVEKEKLIEKKYADILEEVMIKYYKGHEHGKIKRVSGEELDRLYKNSLDYIKRLKQLRKQIETRVQEKSIEQVYKDSFGMLGALLNKKNEKEIILEFDRKMVQTGKFPKKFLENLEFIARVRKDVLEEGNKKSAEERKKENVDIMTGKEINQVDQARKFGNELVNLLIEHNQRCEMLALNKTRFIVKFKDRQAEVFFLNETFFVEQNKIFKVSDKKLVSSDLTELNKALEQQKGKAVKMNYRDLEVLEKKFGDFELES